MTAPKKKIYLASMDSGNVEIPGVGGTIMTAYDQFMAEEDITIIGWTFDSSPSHTAWMAGVGVCTMYCRLAQGYTLTGGCTGWLDSIHTIQRQSALHEAYSFQHSNYAFPEGEGLSMSEGESLYLYVVGNNSAAAAVASSFTVHLFYVKGAR